MQVRSLAPWLGRWPIALAACAVLAALVLLPGLDRPGLWEPNERQLSDRVAPPLSVTEAPTVIPAAALSPEPACQRAVPKDAVARSLTPRLIVIGRDVVGDSDGGRRLPLALLGLLTVLAAAGIAMRTAGARAGIVTALVLLAMPLLVFQSRMLTSEIGTACGAALIIYGLVALALPVRASPWHVVDPIVAGLAIAAGIVVGFVGGGMLLGMLVPIGAYAAACGFGMGMIKSTQLGGDGRVGPHLVALFAGIAALVCIAILAEQMYSLKDPYPGLPPPLRQVLGKAVVPDGCYSSALGAVWRPDDDLRYIYDSTFEQIAYGTFPWGLLAPVAMLSLLRDREPGKRLVGAVTLAWAGAAWLAQEAFQRRVGFTIWAGFPAIAIAIGAWLDGTFSRAARGERDAVPGGAFVLAAFLFLGVLDLGKDMQSFTEKVTSLLVGSDAIQYPTQAKLMFLSVRLWVLVLGCVIALATALALILWKPERRRAQLTTTLAAGALGASFIMSAFWAFAWQGQLAQHLSSKALFETIEDLRKPADQLVIMGDLGHAPKAYIDAKPEIATAREQVVAALKRDSRVFAIAPVTELCQIHREVGDKPYFVIDDRNVRNLLLSNRVDGAEDLNPLREMIAHKEPANIPYKPKTEIVWDNRIQLLGWDIPKSVSNGEKFDVVIYYKILQSVGGAWTSLLHIDGALRWQGGDHKPIKDRCSTATWQSGDFIIDRHPMIGGGGGAAPSGRYEIWIGFFTGQTPNFTNMTISKAPGDQRDANNRVKITTIDLD